VRITIRYDIVILLGVLNDEKAMQHFDLVLSPLRGFVGRKN
jgi:hypothetical protein